MNRNWFHLNIQRNEVVLYFFSVFHCRLDHSCFRRHSNHGKFVHILIGNIFCIFLLKNFFYQLSHNRCFSGAPIGRPVLLFQYQYSCSSPVLLPTTNVLGLKATPVLAIRIHLIVSLFHTAGGKSLKSNTLWFLWKNNLVCLRQQPNLPKAVILKK